MRGVEVAVGLLGLRDARDDRVEPFVECGIVGGGERAGDRFEGAEGVAVLEHVAAMAFVLARGGDRSCRACRSLELVQGVVERHRAVGRGGRREEAVGDVHLQERHWHEVRAVGLAPRAAKGGRKGERARHRR